MLCRDKKLSASTEREVPSWMVLCKLIDVVPGRVYLGGPVGWTRISDGVEREPPRVLSSVSRVGSAVLWDVGGFVGKTPVNDWFGRLNLFEWWTFEVFRASIDFSKWGKRWSLKTVTEGLLCWYKFGSVWATLRLFRGEWPRVGHYSNCFLVSQTFHLPGGRLVLLLVSALLSVYVFHSWLCK